MTQPLDSVINEVRLLYQSLVQIGDALHSGLKISMGMRAVLEYLERHGDTTVPDIARERRVTRQRIQTLANALLERDWITTRDNPASRRSPLLALTPTGVRTIRDMRLAESRLLSVDIPDRRLQEAQATLKRLREALEAQRERQE